METLCSSSLDLLGCFQTFGGLHGTKVLWRTPAPHTAHHIQAGSLEEKRRFWFTFVNNNKDVILN